MLTIDFTAAPTLDARALALPRAAGQPLADLLTDESVRTLVEAAGEHQEDKAGSLVDTLATVEGRLRRLLVVGTGSDDAAETAGAALVGRLLTSGETGLVVDLRAIDSAKRGEIAARLAQGALIRSWRHDRYRTRMPARERVTLAQVEIVVGEEALAAAQAAWLPRHAAAEGAAFTRELVAEPANILYPESFVERCRALTELGVEVEVLDEAAMRELGMGALLGVAQGSARPPRLLCLKWDGTGGTADPIAFVGKGVTFDTGGISIKPAAGMESMKWDMGGAGAVAGAIKALALRKARAHVIGVCGLVENMPDGNAQRPGDVVTSMSGQTIEVINTDAEGRLVLCDAISWVQRTYKVRTIVDLATLTGAILISLGHEYAGLFANDDTLAGALTAAGDKVGEKLWRMPMGPAFDKLIDSPIADMKNVGPREGGSTTAAQFIGRFIEDGVRWAHLDIAGMAWAEKPGALCDKGATGYGVRLLDQFVKDTVEG